MWYKDLSVPMFWLYFFLVFAIIFVLYGIIYVYDKHERKSHAQRKREEEMMVKIDDAISDEVYVWD